jgi:hypothetical protein
MSEQTPNNTNSQPQPLKWEQQLPEWQRPGAKLLRQLDAVPPLSQIAVARIRRRLDAELSVGKRYRFPRWFMAIALAAVFLTFIEVAAAALVASWPTLRHRLVAMTSATLSRSHVPTLEPPAIPTMGESPETRSTAPPPQTSAPVPALTLAPGSAKSEGTPPRPARASVHNRVVAALEHPPEDESTVLAKALVQMHARHDPEGALAMFEAYGFEYPNGALRGEAAVGQIEALLALERNAEAMALIEAMQREGFAGVPRVSDLRLLHAELLGKLDRCNEALPAIGEYLLPSATSQQRERALVARASCRAQLGDIDGSRDDLQTYLREFPHGRFAPKALIKIGNLSSPSNDD